MFNIIEFNPLDDGRTEIVTWGIGYGSGPEQAQMLEFFAKGNEYTLNLLSEAMDGRPVDWENLEVPGAEPGAE